MFDIRDRLPSGILPSGILPEDRRIRRAVLAAGSVVGVFVLLYLAGLLAGSDDIPGGTRVREVGIGGLSQQEARQKLAGSEDLVPAELPVRLGGQDGQDGRLSTREAGISLDAEETAARAAQSGSGPLTVIGRLFSGGGGDVEPVVTVDETKARKALAATAESYDRKARDGSIAFHEGEPVATEARGGRSLDVDEALGVLGETDPTRQDGPLRLPVRKDTPRVGTEEVDRAMREFAEPAMSGPVTLTAEGSRIDISAAAVGASLTMEADKSGRLTPRLDGRRLSGTPEVAGVLRQATDEAVDAKLRLDGGQVQVASDGRAGREVTPRAIEEAVLALLPESGADARTGPVDTEVVQPKLTRENVGRLGIKEQMSTFTVEYPAAAYRTQNVGRAAELIDGSVVLPGEVWSFNRTVGPRTEANGFTEGVIIQDGQYVRASGGGISALATTIFNAAFFAGVDFVEYGAHSFYIERYPEGREATVAWGSLDLRFRNNTGNAVYIQAGSTADYVQISFLGTKKYDSIESVKGPRTSIQAPGSRTGDPGNCEPQTPLEGFDVTVDRIFRSGGKEVDRETFSTSYTPRDSVTCG